MWGNKLFPTVGFKMDIGSVAALACCEKHSFPAFLVVEKWMQ